MDGIRDINWPAGLRSWQVWQVYWKTKTNKQTNKQENNTIPASIGIGMVQHQNTKHMNDSLNMNIIQHSMKRTKPQRQQHAKVWFLTQTFCKWYDFHFIQRGYESPHMMYWGHIETWEFDVSYSKMRWSYSLKAVIIWKPAPYIFGGFYTWHCSWPKVEWLNDALLVSTGIAKFLLSALRNSGLVTRVRCCTVLTVLIPF